MLLNARTIILNRYRTKLILLAIEDITEKKLIDERTEQFINMASHELRTPIASIVIFLQILEKKLRKGMDRKSSEIMSRIVDKLNVLNNLIRDLFDARKMKQGTLIITRKPAAVYPIIQESVELFGYVAPDRQIVLSGNSADKAFVDKDRITQVVTNLLNNAVKYSRATQPIYVHVSRKNKNIITSVSDTGIGIPKKEQKTIFDAYNNAQASSEKKGLGMGLFICKEIVQLHNGKIWLESTYRKGSTFYFSLPVITQS